MREKIQNRFGRQELAGSLGDLGVFIPLLVGMVNQCGLQIGPALLAAGLMNVTTGFVFGIPMPVQPMKAIAAVAIAEGLNESQILTAGIITGAVILVLGVSGLINVLNRSIPKSVVRGLQLALGLKLVGIGLQRLTQTNEWIAWDSIGMGILCASLILVLYGSKRIPGALVVFVIGLLALFGADPSVFARTSLGMSWSWPELGNPHDWAVGFRRGALPQIPLTLLNSVISICALSLDLFPGRGASPKRVSISVGLMNLVCCPFGGMPMCHGAGGLAAQYRFGARTGGSVIILGVAKIVLALLFGSSLLVWLQAYPQSVLGVLLMFGGLELGLICRDQTKHVDFLVMFITAGACLALNTAVGFVIGWFLSGLVSFGVVRIQSTSNDK